MDEKELARQLEREGFARTFVWEDAPHAFYPEHTHRGETAHVILGGEMTLTQGGVEKTYHQGERCDVPAGVAHTAKMGSRGCRYLVGER
ncbi:MAG TPA: cupin domain-containing protein [Candidatus Saccharimonadales bacterium]|nr:cupin domain-containing protein [Candidatus Saccharimonadales bacterium]